MPSIYKLSEKRIAQKIMRSYRIVAEEHDRLRRLLDSQGGKKDFIDAVGQLGMARANLLIAVAKTYPEYSNDKTF